MAESTPSTLSQILSAIEGLASGSAEDVAQVMLIYFPGSRASMKDKQYYEDMAAEMLRIEQRSRDKTVTAK